MGIQTIGVEGDEARQRCLPRTVWATEEDGGMDLPSLEHPPDAADDGILPHDLGEPDRPILVR
jgi:hypothetical protein